MIDDIKLRVFVGLIGEPQPTNSHVEGCEPDLEDVGLVRYANTVHRVVAISLSTHGEATDTSLSGQNEIFEPFASHKAHHNTA